MRSEVSACASGSPSRRDSFYRTPQMAAMSLRCDQNAPKIGSFSEVCEVCGGLSPTDVSQLAQTEHSESKIMCPCCLGRGILHLKAFDGHIHRRIGILKMGPEPLTSQTSRSHRGNLDHRIALVTSQHALSLCLSQLRSSVDSRALSRSNSD